MKADELNRRVLAIRKQVAPEEVPGSFMNLGNVAHARGDISGAERYWLQGLAIREKVAPQGTYADLKNLADLAREQGDLLRAEAYLRRALVDEEQES